MPACTPKIGDKFRIGTRALFTGGTITKINKVYLIYESICQPRPDYSGVMTLKMTIRELNQATISRDGQIIQQPNP